MLLKISILICFASMISFSLGTPPAEDLECWNLIKCYETKVNNLLNDQIAVELQGHYTYLFLSHLFMRSDMYYPRAAKYFKDKSDEEMQHAEKFIEYQNRRGGKFEIKPVHKHESHCNNIASLKDGFTCARRLEVHVTRALTKLLKDISEVKPIRETSSDHCNISDDNTQLLFAQPIIVEFTRDGGEKETEPFNDLDCSGISRFHKVEYVELAEMITHEFLGHQIEDTKELANYENLLKGFERQKLGSFIADKEFEF